MSTFKTNEKINQMMKLIVPIDHFSKNMSLQNDLGIDSLLLVNVLVQLEEIFDITIDISDLNPKALITMEDLYTLAEKYVCNKEE